MDLTPAPVLNTRLAWQRTWLAYAGGLIVTLRTACERRADAAVFSLATTAAATGAMLLVRRVHRLGQAAHTRRRHTLRPRAVGLATTALLACSLALPVLHALTLSAAAGRPHLQRQIAHRPRIEAAAPPGPPPVPRFGPAIALARPPASHAAPGRRVRRLPAAAAHRRASWGVIGRDHRCRRLHRHRSVWAAGPEWPRRSSRRPRRSVACVTASGAENRNQETMILPYR